MLQVIINKALRGFCALSLFWMSGANFCVGTVFASHPEAEALNKAIDQAQPEIVEKELKILGPQMGQPSPRGNALWDHAESRAMDAFKLLMEDGVMVTMDEIPEEVEVWNQSLEKVIAVYEKLLDVVADPRTKTHYRMRLLKQAILEGPEESIGLLLKQGYPVEAQDETGATPLLFAIQAGKWRMVKRLLDEGADPNSASMLETPLMLATQGGDAKSARLLLEREAKVDAQLFNGETALWYAIRDSNEKMILLLLDFKANLNARTRFDDTPLMAAALSGNAQVVQILLDRGADPNHTDSLGQTALMLAAGARNLEAVNALLSADADVNATTVKGESALIRAVQRSNNAAVVQALLAKGADPDITTAGGLSARTAAADLGDPDYLALFQRDRSD